MKDSSWISKLSLGFITRYRVTVLLLIGTLVLGLFSYTTLLKREGFPPIEVPVALVQVPYFVGDANAVNEDVTNPIETAIADIPEINTVISSTTDNFSVVQVQFDEGTSSEEGAKKLKEEINNSTELSPELDIKYTTFNAGAIDGEHELVFNISSSNKTLVEMQEKASEVADSLTELNVVLEANVIEVITTEVNPFTGEEVENQSSFNRVGFREDDELKFSQGISIGIKKRGDDTGTLELSKAIRDKVEQLKADDVLDGYSVHFGSGDFADSLEDQIGSLESNIQAGLVAVVIILFLFVNWRASIVTVLFIPTVLAATFVGLYLIGYSLNVLSLFGLILVLGLFVDDAIVVVEAIDYYKKQGDKGMQAVKKAINAVGAADISGTLTTLLVFFPMAMISGVLGDFIKLIPVTVILALVLSLLIALTLIPFAANILIPSERKKKQNMLQKVWNYIINGFPMFVNKLGDLTSRFVRLYLSNPITPFLVIIVSILLIVFGSSYASRLEFSIFPAPKDAESFSVSLSYPEGTTLERAEAIAKKVEREIKNTSEEYVKGVDYYQATSSSALLYVNLMPMAERDETSVAIAENLLDEIENFNGVSIKVDQNSAGPPTSDFQFFVQVYDDDQETLVEVTDSIVDFIDEKDINDDVSVTDVAVDNLESISKKDGKRYAQVKAKISDPQDTAAVLELIDQVEKKYDADKLEDLGLNEDSLGFDLGQESENLESFNSAIFAMLVAMILMYGLLVFQFNSFTQPFLIFTAIPFAFVGLFPGLVATDQFLSFFVMIGLTGLIGIVVNNTIMLIDFANQERRSGKGVVDSIVAATKVRFRPLMTTSVTTVAGLLPLALSDPFWEPLSFTIIFGLISSTLMVILVFPAYYAVLEKLRVYKSKAARKIGVSMS